MEASSLRHPSRSGLLGRRSPLLRLQGDEHLVALIRAGHDHAFEILFDRYHTRLLSFCRHMLGSSEDAEDVLQEVFTKAHAAILADDRHIHVRPWLYRIARNRCLNHLRKPVPEGKDSMDVLPHDGGKTTAERVQSREEFRALVSEVRGLPETQRTALLLREIEALSYEEIGAAMDTTVPAVKSLLVRARMSLAEATQARLLTCGDVQLELAEAAEGLRKVSAPVRRHIRECEECSAYRSELRSNQRRLSALAPPGLLVWLQSLLGAKLLGGGSSSATGGAASGAAGAGSGAVAGGGAAGASGAAASASGAAAASGGAAIGGAAAAAGGGIGGAVATKAATGLATAALITAGAVEVRHLASQGPDTAEPVAGQAVGQASGSPAPSTAAGADGERERERERDGARRGGDEPEEASEGQADDGDAPAEEPAGAEADEDAKGEDGPESSDATASESPGGVVGGGARGRGDGDGPRAGAGGLPALGPGAPPVTDPGDPGDDPPEDEDAPGEDTPGDDPPDEDGEDRPGEEEPPDEDPPEEREPGDVESPDGDASAGEDSAPDA